MPLDLHELVALGLAHLLHALAVHVRELLDLVLQALLGVLWSGSWCRWCAQERGGCAQGRARCCRAAPRTFPNASPYFSICFITSLRTLRTATWGRGGGACAHVWGATRALARAVGARAVQCGCWHPAFSVIGTSVADTCLQTACVCSTATTAEQAQHDSSCCATGSARALPKRKRPLQGTPKCGTCHTCTRHPPPVGGACFLEVHLTPLGV